MPEGENHDRWGVVGDPAFLIHFVGDLHQPLHATNDADRASNCVKVESLPRAKRSGRGLGHHPR
ncbi:MAG: S1/P1 nuclease [Candidatus Binatales bacterium]